MSLFIVVCTAISMSALGGQNTFSHVGTGASMNCLKADGSLAPCGPGNDQCGPALQNGPQYHLTDKSCEMNDPNGPFYDAEHGMYHVFYQDHLWAPMPSGVPTGREGPVWGHAVSRDMVHWTHLPVGLWNGDGWYNMHGIFTGSATIVPELGGPALIFPGVCDLYPPGSSGSAVPGCKYGYAFGMATPANRSDPLLQNWTRVGSIANDTFDDPSTAWKTPSGEWRFIGHCGDGVVGDCGPSAPKYLSAPIWSSRDFRTWRRIGFTNLPAGECASLYPLPPLVNGTWTAMMDGNGSAGASSADYPTHVHKWGCGWTKDCYALGRWVDGATETDPGSWTTSSSSPEDGLLEHGIYYAAKDFWDERHGRRIQWGWAPLYTNSLALPREVRYDPRLQQLVFSPLAEQSLLRNGTIAQRTSVLLGPGVSVNLSASAQSEAELKFSLPHEAVALSAQLIAPSSDGDGSVQALTFGIEYSPPPSQPEAAFHTVRVTGSSTAKPKALGGRASTSSVAGTHFRTGREAEVEDWNFSSQLRLLPGEAEKELTLRLFFDHTIAEAYWQGRVAMTLPLSTTNWAESRVELVVAANTTASLSSANVWTVGSMWVTQQDVIG